MSHSTEVPVVLFFPKPHLIVVPLAPVAYNSTAQALALQVSSDYCGYDNNLRAHVPLLRAEGKSVSRIAGPAFFIFGAIVPSRAGRTHVRN